jgi:uncharacterized protein (DUF2164 family)
MAIKLQKPERDRLVASVKRYCAENLEPVGDLQAGLLLDFFLIEAGPVVYNQAVADATARILNHATDLPGEVYEPEVDYWRRPRGGRA